MFQKFCRITTYFVIWIGLTALLFFLLEVSARLWVPAHIAQAPGILGQKDMHAFSSFAWKEEYFLELRNRESALISAKKYEPYSLWKENPFQGKLLNIGKEGYRKTLHPYPVIDNSPKIFVFGGSTVFAAQGPDQFTIPSFIAQELSNNFNEQRFELNNFGIDGFVLRQEVNLLQNLLIRGERPSIVIFYDGANDIFNNIVAGVPHTFYERFASAVDRRLALREAFFSVTNRLAILRLFRPDGAVGYLLDPNEMSQRAEKLKSQMEELYKLVRVLGQAYGFTPIFMWQPTIFDNPKELSTEETSIRDSERPEVRQVYELSRDAFTPGWMSEQGVVDCRSCLESITESVFVDFCHVTATANQSIASQLAKEVRKVLNSTAVAADTSR